MMSAGEGWLCANATFTNNKKALANATLFAQPGYYAPSRIMKELLMLHWE